jgi:hypothetical protein
MSIVHAIRTHRQKSPRRSKEKHRRDDREQHLTSRATRVGRRPLHTTAR